MSPKVGLARSIPGSFVLSFSYSEALMLALVGATLLLLLDERWLLAGLSAAAATASRPNAIAICAACAVAAWIAWRRHHDWRALARTVPVAPRCHRLPALPLGPHGRGRRVVPRPGRGVEGRRELRLDGAAPHL